MLQVMGGLRAITRGQMKSNPEETNQMRQVLPADIQEPGQIPRVEVT